ncbi:MAG: LPXTG-motif cell wall anchor domain [Dactylosporangium sp.]|jgi:LPXTG-motif cell wall-anchored protein|nr:LPXTG-motif cell wall anchor domain [Dactylosporangium sp.]
MAGVVTTLCGNTTFHPDPIFWGYHLRRFVPSTRRMSTLAGAAFVGIAATAMFAAPASAWHANVHGTPTCDQETGTWTVTWSADNTSEGKPAKVSVDSYAPAGSHVNIAKPDIPKLADTDGVAVQTGIPANATTAMLKLRFQWYKDTGSDKGKILDDKTFEGTVGIPATPCEKKPPASGGGGGGTTPTPTPTPTATKTTAAPTLPVTGSQTGLYAGGAVVLLGAGAGLFMVARRRRVNFEA